MKGIQPLLERFRTPLTIAVVAAVLASCGLVAVNAAALHDLLRTAQAAAEPSDLASVSAKQQTLEAQLTSLKAEAATVATDATTVASTTQTTTTSQSSTSTTSGTVHLNQADLTALETLAGIGVTKAQAILDYRNAHGGFHSIDDLLDVKGIGDATLAKIRPQLSLD